MSVSVAVVAGQVVPGFLGIEVFSLDGTSVLERRVSLTPEQLAAAWSTTFGATTGAPDTMPCGTTTRTPGYGERVSIVTDERQRDIGAKAGG